MTTTYRRRRRIERLMFGATATATLLTLGVLVFLLGYIAWQGATSLSWSFFTALPAPVGEAGGGMANAIVGSAKLLLTAALSWAASTWPSTAAAHSPAGCATPPTC